MDVFSDYGSRLEYSKKIHAKTNVFTRMYVSMNLSYEYYSTKKSSSYQFDLILTCDSVWTSTIFSECSILANGPCKNE